ncbi:MAG: di-trans,poly-cis-decaprenylcistransferase [Christensenellaceae bacterium]|jgi:undecaprenyl diphosphate synthase|nr:di-trans,poly-cis-decaprenylcistransferase [Christensenellaceae bacterium]
MNHLAIIMDGNGRWAEKRDLNRLAGHKQGALAVANAIKAVAKSNIQFLSLYAFSTENFKRPKEEVDGVFSIIVDFFKNDILNLITEYNCRILFLGDDTIIPQSLCELINTAITVSLDNKGLTVAFAIGYGGRAEVVNAVNKLLKKRVLINDDSLVTYKELNAYLETSHMPDPELVVRYGGHKRLSNFMPLQTAYSDFLFLDKLWPEFIESDIDNFIDVYARTIRNYGDITQ